jgi:hypothetical protein
VCLLSFGVAGLACARKNCSHDCEVAADEWNKILLDGTKAVLHFFLNMLGKLRKTNKIDYFKLVAQLKTEIEETQATFKG